MPGPTQPGAGTNPAPAAYGAQAHASVISNAGYGSARPRVPAPTRPAATATAAVAARTTTAPRPVQQGTTATTARPPTQPGVRPAGMSSEPAQPPPVPDSAAPPLIKDPREALAAAQKTSVPLPIVEQLASVRRIRKLTALIDPKAQLTHDAALFIDDLVGHFVEDAVSFAADIAKLRLGIAGDFSHPALVESGTKKQVASVDPYDVALYVKEVYPQLSLPLPPFTKHRPLPISVPALPTNAALLPARGHPITQTQQQRIIAGQQQSHAQVRATPSAARPSAAPTAAAGVKRPLPQTSATISAAPAAKRPNTGVS